MIYIVDVDFFKKYLSLLIIAFFLFSCNSTNSSKSSHTKFLGYWQRVDDEAKGDVILIKAEKNSTILASYENLSDFSKKYGYTIGEIKFKSVKKINDKSLQIINLASFMQIDYKTKKVLGIKKEYVPFTVKLISDDILEFKEIGNNTKNISLQLNIGKTQKWKKIKK